MTDVPEEVIDLVERFERNIERYKGPDYREEDLKHEFINPFFEALGWDVQNKKGRAPQYRDVIFEDSIKTTKGKEAPDYCFTLAGTKMFFVEAKNPSVDIRKGVGPAYQLRRYAWSANLAISILTDFEEFAVYESRKLPKKDDKASVERVKYLNYKEYVENWEWISSIFSRESVYNGNFDKFAEGTKKKRGTQEVDDEFLKDMEQWRVSLAKNIALRNVWIGQRLLNHSVQLTIDRIIFIRMCEDRGIERFEQLLETTKKGDIYTELGKLFRKADEKYNSGLFHFRKERGRETQPDEFTLTLRIDDKVLKDIIKHLYYPDCPYEFSVLPPEILGNVYEQFLGKVIRLTAGHRAKVEDKPEVKKAGGVYYTPKYIVDYIVENTVGKLCDGKSPDQISKLHILDPACGSGSFLLGAFTYLINYHRDYYMEQREKKTGKGKKKFDEKIYQGKGGEWQLDIREKKRILLNNIHGVDIDSQAVEVTKLSLLLKVLEGESRQLTITRERALPDLGNNIKCGNSLIGTDFYTGGIQTTLDDSERLRINAFDWETEFKEIMDNGGFDAVIGNPPYIFTRELLSDTERQYFSSHYQYSWEKHNTFMLFMEISTRLLKASGKCSYIVPNSWLTIESGHLLRELLLNKVEVIIDFNYQVFQGVSMEPSIFIFTGKSIGKPISVLRVQFKEEFSNSSFSDIDRNIWSNEQLHRYVFSENENLIDIIDAVAMNNIKIGDIFNVFTGLQAYEKGKGAPPQTADDVKNHIYDRDNWENEDSYKYFQGWNVDRYQYVWSGKWMQYGNWLSQPRKIENFTSPRILLREITGSLPHCLKSCLVLDSYLNNKSILNILHPESDIRELKCLLGILNSTLISVYYKQKAVKSARKIFPKVVIRNLREFPYPKMITEKNSDFLSNLIERMIELYSKLLAMKSPHEKQTIQRQIDAIDKQIDALVYKLYGLTEEEINIVEESL